MFLVGAARGRITGGPVNIMGVQEVVNGLWGRLRVAMRHDWQDRVTQDSAVVLTGQIFSMGLGIISSAVLARGLGPEGLSAFALVGAATSIVSTMSDLGMRLSAIRYIAPALAMRKQQAYAFAAAYGRLKLLSSFGITIILLLVADPLAGLIQLPAQAGAMLLRVGAVAMLATMLSGMVATVLHALGRFRRLILAQSVNVALTVALMSLLWIAGRLDVKMALVVGGITAAVAGLLSLALVPKDWRRALGSRGLRGKWLNGQPLGGDESRQLLSFSRWIWVSNIFSIIAVQIDVLLLNYFLPLPVVGVYVLSRNLAQKASAVNLSIHTVLVPTVSRLGEAGGRRAYVRRSLARSLLLAGAILLVAPLARPFILLVYGEEYASSINFFYALLIVVLFDLMLSPLILLALPLDRPRLLALAEGAQAIVLLVVGVAFVPRLGVYGIVAAKLAAQLVMALVALPPLLRTVRQG